MTQTLVPYTPATWNDSQRALHTAASLEEAFHHASCLAGGWYRCPVTIDSRVTADNNEEYMMRPAAVPVADGWSPCYTVERAQEPDLSRAGAILGASTSARKRFSSRENGKRGGRPPKPSHAE